MTLSLKNLVKNGSEKIIWKRYHYIHHQKAAKVLQHLEREYGKLLPQHKKQCTEYAHEKLGWKGFAPWLKVYTAFTGEFMEGWIPDNYFGAVVVPKIQGLYGKMSSLKPMTNHLFRNSICPDLAYHINGNWFNKDYRPISYEQVLKECFPTHTKVVFKQDDSLRGLGIHIFNQHQMNPSKFKELGNGVLQYFIKQHPFFDQFSQTSVASLRLTTVVEKNGSINLRGGFLRVGRTEDTHIQSSSELDIPINLVTGQLFDWAFLPSYSKTEQHPDSGISFGDIQLPNYQECVKLVLTEHAKLPMVGAIGWDVIVDHDDKVQVLEWNGYGNDIKMSEMSHGPSFMDLGWEKLHLHPKPLLS